MTPTIRPTGSLTMQAIVRQGCDGHGMAGLNTRRGDELGPLPGTDSR
jgi:hypothetical protein